LLPASDGHLDHILASGGSLSPPKPINIART